MKNKHKITLIVHDLSSNPIVRAYPLALALQRIGYEVEIVGFLINSDQVYMPYSDKFNFKTVYIGNGGMFQLMKGLPKLLDLITGDIIYVFKPLTTTLLVGLIKSRLGFKKQLIMDAEDDELAFRYRNFTASFYNMVLRGWNYPNSYFKLLTLHLLLFPAKVRTVVSSKLQRRYGGTIILHGPDEITFNPELFDKESARQEFGLPLDKTLILFAGIPHEHKGVGIIRDAILAVNDERYIFVGAGPSDHEEFVELKKKLGNRCILLGTVGNEKMPLLLSAVDIVPTIQKRTKFTESQMPAKLFEAMAMGKIIIATDTSDIGLVLGKNEKLKRGYLIDFDNKTQFIDVLKQISDNPEDANMRSKEARGYFLKEASVDANMKKLSKVICLKSK